ncbi:hypothetical protein GCM10027590_51830 [Nocardiopsis nanhaiensis]
MDAHPTERPIHRRGFTCAARLASVLKEARGAAHARVTRRLTGTITQATANRTSGQNGVRHGENKRNRISRNRGSEPVYALPDSFRPKFSAERRLRGR